jgi:hypothetical protein
MTRCVFALANLPLITCYYWTIGIDACKRAAVRNNPVVTDCLIYCSALLYSPIDWSGFDDNGDSGTHCRRELEVWYRTQIWDFAVSILSLRKACVSRAYCDRHDPIRNLNTCTRVDDTVIRRGMIRFLSN